MNATLSRIRAWAVFYTAFPSLALLPLIALGDDPPPSKTAPSKTQKEPRNSKEADSEILKLAKEIKPLKAQIENDITPGMPRKPFMPEKPVAPQPPKKPLPNAPKKDQDDYDKALQNLPNEKKKYDEQSKKYPAELEKYNKSNETYQQEYRTWLETEAKRRQDVQSKIDSNLARRKYLDEWKKLAKNKK